MLPTDKTFKIMQASFRGFISGLSESEKIIFSKSCGLPVNIGAPIEAVSMEQKKTNQLEIHRANFNKRKN